MHACVCVHVCVQWCSVHVYSVTRCLGLCVFVCKCVVALHFCVITSCCVYFCVIYN